MPAMKNNMRYFLLFLFFTAASCKPRQQDTSSAKQLFAERWREIGINTAEVPFIIALENGCSGFVLDWEDKIAMTAAHCEPEETQKVYFQASSTHDLEGQVARGEAYHGIIQNILAKRVQGELDYVVFNFSSNHSFKDLIGTEAVLLDDEQKFGELLANKTQIYMTGYPSDVAPPTVKNQSVKNQYADSRLSRSRCNVRSEIRLTPRAAANKEDWKKLIAAWEAPDTPEYPNPYRANGKEYSDMRACYPEVASGNNGRFYYDCSVYGGNSGGPIYYIDPVTQRAVVIGLPTTFKRGPQSKIDDAKDFADCNAKYVDKYFKPIIGAAAYPLVTKEDKNTPSATIPATRNWENSSRQDDYRTFPTAAPVTRMISASPFFTRHTELWASNAKSTEAIQGDIKEAEALKEKARLDAIALEKKQAEVEKARIARLIADAFAKQQEAEIKRIEKKAMLKAKAEKENAERLERENKENEELRQMEANLQKATIIKKKMPEPIVVKEEVQNDERSVPPRSTNPAADIPEVIETTNLDRTMLNMFFQTNVRNLNVWCTIGFEQKKLAYIGILNGQADEVRGIEHLYYFQYALEGQEKPTRWSIIMSADMEEFRTNLRFHDTIPTKLDGKGLITFFNKVYFRRDPKCFIKRK